MESLTRQPYSYAGSDPLDEIDPTGLDSCGIFSVVCDTLVNIGRGATGGLTDKIDNWISPGSSCTVAQSTGVQDVSFAVSMLDGEGEVAAALDAEHLVADGTKIPDAALDVTGKVHGDLPRPGDLSQYDPEALAQLRDELQQSVQKRIEMTVQLGADPAHSDRLAEEQALIRSIDKNLADR